MRTIETKLYTYEELSDKAKEKARDWWKECESQDFGDHGELLESAETAAKLLGITFNTRRIPLMGGGTRTEPNVWWSLHTQGSGASFDGLYSYAKGSVKAIRGEFSTDTDLYQIAADLADIQKKNGYGLSAVIEASRHSVHEYGMTFEVTDARGFGVPDETADDIRGAMRAFARWIHKGIEAEWDYRMSDANVIDSISANEYEFTEDGEIA